jgi:hypothetical protein
LINLAPKKKGMSLTFRITSIAVNQYQSISWLTCTIALMNNQTVNYKSLLHGLLGNNNGNELDDADSKFGDKPSDINDERHVFETTKTCNLMICFEFISKNVLYWPCILKGRLTKQDVSLFTISYDNQPYQAKYRRLIGSEQYGVYVPKFFNDLSINSSLNASCNYMKPCIYDSIILGSAQAGQDTKEQLLFKSLAQAQLTETPPLINFRTNVIKIDWNDQKPIIIIADITDASDFTVMFNVTNAMNVITDVSKIAPGYVIATITYYPKQYEYPTFE